MIENKSNKELSEQSKAWILEALTLIIEKAGVDRKTFYRHFQSKHNVLCYYLDRACQFYIEKLSAETELTTYIVSKVYFETCLHYLDFLLLLDKNNLLPFMLLAFDKYLPEIHRVFERQRTADSIIYRSEYALAFYTGGFWNISIKWLKEKTPKSPDEMASIIEKLLTQPL